MTKKKQYYVVIHGRQPGLYDQWFGGEGAAEQVDGLADAVYKGFYTLEEAIEWLRQIHAETIPGLAPDLADLLDLAPEQPRREGPSALLEAGKILIYTDGGAVENPGPGGWHSVLRYWAGELSGGFRWTTDATAWSCFHCIEGLHESPEARMLGGPVQRRGKSSMA